MLYEHRASDLLKRMDVINTMVDCVPQVLALVSDTSLTAARDDFTRVAVMGAMPCTAASSVLPATDQS